MSSNFVQIFIALGPVGLLMLSVLDPNGSWSGQSKCYYQFMISSASAYFSGFTSDGAENVTIIRPCV